MTPPIDLRKRLPIDRPGLIHRFTILTPSEDVKEGEPLPPPRELKGYVTVGVYPDTGLPGEIFITLHSVGSLEHGMADALAMTASIALQHGVPLRLLVDKWKHLKFEPAGITSSSNSSLRFADSVLDYVARWLELKFLNKSEGEKPDGQ